MRKLARSGSSKTEFGNGSRWFLAAMRRDGRRERGRGCYPDGCRQRSDRSAALRAVPERWGRRKGNRRRPRAQTRGFISERGQRRLAAIVRRCPASSRSANSRGGEPTPAEVPSCILREDCARGAQSPDDGDPSEIRVSYCAIFERRWPFFALSRAKGRAVFARRLYAKI